MRAWVRFGVLSTAVITGLAWLVTLRWTEPTAVRAIWSSAVIASVVQLVGFAVARPLMRENPIAGWGLGSIVRFAAVVIHAVLGVPALGVPSGTALVSLVGFLFLTMLFEPLFLRS